MPLLPLHQYGVQTLLQCRTANQIQNHDTENRVQLLVDRDLLEEATFGCHPCINTSTIRMQTGDVFDKLTTALHHPYTIVTLKGE